MRTSRFLNLPLPCYAPEGVGSVSGAPNGSAPPSSPSGTAASSSPAAGGVEPASAPSVEPAPSAAPATPATPADSDVPDFGGLGAEDLDGDEVTVPSNEELGAAVPQQAPPQQPQQPAPQAPVPPQATPPAEPQAPQTPQGTAPQEQPPSAPTTPGSLAQQLQEHRADVIAHLAATEFALTKEEAERLGDPEMAPMVSQMAARVYHRAINASLLHMQNFVPMIAASVMQALEENRKKEDGFYGQFKYLDRSKHAGDVQNFMNVFRQQNPQIQEKDLWARVASAVKALHGLQDAPVAPPNQPQQPQVPAFIPARPGGGGVQMVPVDNPWEGLGAEHDEG